MALTLFASPVLANGFTSPSGNIICYVDQFDDMGDFIGFEDQRLRCLIFDADWTPPPYYGDDDSTCDVDRTRAMNLPYSGPATEQWICHGDVFWPQPLGAISYGSEWSWLGYRCSMATDGVRCLNQAGGSFAVNRARRQLN